MPEIKVNFPENAYSIVIEPGVLSRLGQHVKTVAPHARCLLAMDANVVQPHGEIAKQSLEAAGYEVITATLTADEKHKTLASVESLYRTMLAAKLERRSPVIALGGGVVGDVAGYAAATYLRGVPLIQVPTTLLAMVDASIGGKTGVNFPLPDSSDLGKNLIGAFWQPKVVIVDPKVLLTLRRRDFVCGLAECIKHAIIADASLLQWIHDNAKEILALFVPKWEELIARSAAIKAAIVAEDEREGGRRMHLNLGHTFAHALESIPELDTRHGEAVALGLAAACHVARAQNRITANDAKLIHDTISRCELPHSLHRGWTAESIKRFLDRPDPPPEYVKIANEMRASLESRPDVYRLLKAMSFDKKSADGKLRLVLPRGIGAADVVEDVSPNLVRDALRSIGARDGRD